jgi:hypothetical protein
MDADLGICICWVRGAPNCVVRSDLRCLERASILCVLVYIWLASAGAVSGEVRHYLGGQEFR